MKNSCVKYLARFSLGLFFLVVLAAEKNTSSRDFSPPLSCKEILLRMLSEIDKIKTQKFHLSVIERIEGRLINSESDIKLQRNPRKIYMNIRGIEVLWVHGWNNGYALVNPNGFPWFNLNLDPMGSIMRKDQHHTIHEIGFDYLADVMRHAMKRYGESFDRHFVYSGESKWKNTDCYLLTGEYPEFSYSDYTVDEGETLITIARKFKVSEYMIWEANAGKAGDYYDVKKGQVIKIPKAYGKKTYVYVSKQNFLPVNIKIYDDKGLFEEYSYENLKVDIPFADTEFTPEYEEYNF